MTAVIDQPHQIAAFRLQVIRRAAEVKARTGMSLARNMPTVAALRRQYPDLLGKCRTYQQVAEALQREERAGFPSIPKP